MRIVRYWWLVLRRSWDLLDRAELVVSLAVSIAAGVGVFVLPIPTWLVVPTVLALLLATLLVATPSRIYDEQQDAVRALNASIAPRISVDVVSPKWRTGSPGLFVQLRVTNHGKEPLAGCYGKLLECRRVTGAATAGWIPPELEQHFLWSSRQTDSRLSATISPDSSLLLSIASTNEKENPGLLWLAFTQPEALPLYVVHDLRIEVGAAAGAPVRGWFRITGTGPFDMTFEDVGETPPPP